MTSFAANALLLYFWPPKHLTAQSIHVSFSIINNSNFNEIRSLPRKNLHQLLKALLKQLLCQLLKLLKLLRQLLKLLKST